MSDETKDKILTAALKVFAKEGYKSATIRSIAIDSGFTEMTLFRKFGTKENVFDAAMKLNYEKFQEDYLSLVDNLEQEFESPNEFLTRYVKKLEGYFGDNFEFLSLMVNEDNKIEMDMGELNILIGKYLEKNMNNDKIDYTALGFYINTFLYVLTLEKYHGRKSIKDENTVNTFIESLCLCFN